MKHELIASATASGIADEHHHHNQQQHFHPAGSENAQKHLKQHSPISQKHQHQQFHHHLDIGATSADAAAHGAAPSTTLAASASIVYDGTTTATVNSSVCSGSSSNSSSVPLPLYPAPVGRRLNWTFREKANNVSIHKVNYARIYCAGCASTSASDTTSALIYHIAASTSLLLNVWRTGFRAHYRGL